MCRLFAMTSAEPASPMQAILALDAMREGHDGSGVGLFLSGLSGPFEGLKDCPVLSGIFTRQGHKRASKYMLDSGFKPRQSLSMDISSSPPPGVPARDVYMVQAYDIPDEWKGLHQSERELLMLKTRLALRAMGEKHEDMTVYSFWPDTIMIKEIGDPLTVAKHLQLDRDDLAARVILAQGRQNTNYAINLYACHPFFIQGVCTMTNGENTAFVPIKEYLMGLGVPGYVGYNSDSEVFTHILHYTLKRLKLGIDAYKHVITPLQDQELSRHVDAAFLRNMKNVCRKLIIDGPNCIIGCLPDKTMFMCQDRKKLRPGIVGGRPGLYAFSSEVCGIDAVIPDRDPSTDIQPMHLDTVYVTPERQEIVVCRQTQPLAHLH